MHPLFPGVERLISGFEEFLWSVLRVLQAAHADTEADGWYTVHVAVGEADADVPEFFSDSRSSLRGCLRQCDDKFISTKPCEEVRVSQPPLEVLGHLFEDEIPHEMAEPIVHLLEIVQINHQARQRPLVAFGARTFQCPAGEEEPAIVQTSDLIGGGQQSESF